MTLAAVGSSLLAACGLCADERSQQFLEGLRNRQEFDAALEFLEQSETSGLASADFREVIEFERGLTWLEASRLEQEPLIREGLLAKAADSFRKFMDRHKEHPLVLTARQRLATTLADHGRSMLDRAKRGPADEEAALRRRARRLEARALQHFLQCKDQLHDRLNRLPKVLDAVKDRDTIAERTQLRASYVQTQLLIGATHEQLANTWTPSDVERDAELTTAAKHYGEVYRKYRSRLAGLYAHLYEGRCQQKLGKFDEALKIYETLLNQPDRPDVLRALKTKTMILALECWCEPSQKQYAKALTQGESWLDSLPAKEADQLDGKRIRELVEEARRLEG